MISITGTIFIDEKEIHFDFVRSSGPGGQNVNKVATAAQLRFDAGRTASLPPDVRARLLSLAAGRLTGDGILIINANRFRTQLRNREDALDRLIALIRQATVPPKNRRPTKPSLSARKRRLEGKRRQAEKKAWRRSGISD